MPLLKLLELQWTVCCQHICLSGILFASPVRCAGDVPAYASLHSLYAGGGGGGGGNNQNLKESDENFTDTLDEEKNGYVARDQLLYAL